MNEVPHIHSPQSATPDHTCSLHVDKNESNKIINAMSYTYYSASGACIGESQGSSPQADLFEDANYVFNDDGNSNNNEEVIANIEFDLDKLKKQRLGISVSHIGKLMDINTKIDSLEKLLDVKKKCQENVTSH